MLGIIKIEMISIFSMADPKMYYNDGSYELESGNVG